MSDRHLGRELCRAMEPVRDAILRHPFLTGLADGSLDEGAFARYVIQDAHYVHAYARTLALLAARAPETPELLLLADHARRILAGEGELHADLLAALGRHPDELRATPPGPTCLGYSTYLRVIAYEGSFLTAVAAVLPCYWLYHQVGAVLRARGSPDPRYRRWIDAYAGEAFGAAVEDVVALVDRLGAEAPPAERMRAREACLVSARYEWLFWDAALRDERWPET